MKNYLFPFLLLLISCNGSDEKNVALAPQVNKKRNVYISAASALTIVENSQHQVEISISGDFLQSDLFRITTEMDSLNAAITPDRKFLLLNAGDVNNETVLNLKLSIEGPNNAPNTTIQVKIVDSSGLEEIAKAISIKKIIEEVLKIDEEVSIAKKLYHISPMIISNKDILDSLLRSLVLETIEIETLLQNKLNNLEEAMNSYQARLISEFELKKTVNESKLFIIEFKFSKLKLLNEYLINSGFLLQIPFEDNNKISNFFGNSKIGTNDENKYKFLNEFSFFNEILATECK